MTIHPNGLSTASNKPLQMKLKGSRTYIHGSDMFNQLSAAAGGLTGDDASFVSMISFRRFARNDCMITLEPPPAETLVAEARLRDSAGEDTPVWIAETLEPPAGRYDFDEEGLVAPAVIDGDVITGAANTRYTPIEVAIALTKRLTYHRHPKPAGKWVFGQLELTKALPTDYREMSIRARATIAGRFSRNELMVDGQSYGTMRFIVGTP